MKCPECQTHTTTIFYEADKPVMKCGRCGHDYLKAEPTDKHD